MCPLFVVSNRRPLAPAALPAFIATMDASDFPPPLLPSSLFRLVGECAYAPAVGSPGLLPILVVRLGAAFDPGWAWPACLGTGHTVACWRLETIGPFQRGHYGTPHLHGRRYPLPLLLACFRAYASRALLPASLQGSIPGPWLAVTGTGFAPVRIGSIAQPQPRPDPTVLYPTVLYPTVLLQFLQFYSWTLQLCLTP
jgi:hypothetical protein